MMEASATVASHSIAALPPTTARQIGSGQVLIDANSVVKELIENALDARAKSIFVDITANTIDAIQVRDDGHGVPSGDRPLVCRRYCTSKIRDLHDLREVGGKWLGFRGEALSSMAEMGGALVVTTRVEGEPAAVKLKYSRDGELYSIERDSHPVGTTVKVTNFFENIPVRKQAAIKNAAKCLAKIRRLIQAYILARPSIRFRLHVVKAKNNAGDFVYAPKADASVEDAVLKIFGKDCAMNCCYTAGEADGFKIHAFLPKPTAIGPKISNYGSFVSIDARPVSSNRGTIKQFIRAFRDRFGQANTSLAGIRDPFFCINISCPPGSYDTNIEPAKDDVMFENSDVVLSILNRLLESHYPGPIANFNNDELSLSLHENCGSQPDEVFAQDKSDILPRGCNVSIQDEVTGLAPQPRWRFNMYGIDEDDLEFLHDDRALVIDEEEGLRAVEVSNPWTIARMNAMTKPRQSAANGQLPSPSKSTKGAKTLPSSPKMPASPNQIPLVEPLTPQTPSKTNTMRSPLGDEIECSIKRLPRSVSVAEIASGCSEARRRYIISDGPSLDGLEAELPGSVLQYETQAPENWALPSAQHGNIALEVVSKANRTPHHQQPIRDPKQSKPPPCQKRATNPQRSYFQAGTSTRSQKSLPVAAGQLRENQLRSNNRRDIRDWFRQSEARGNNLVHERSFTPINLQARPIQPRSLGQLMNVDLNRPLPQNEWRIDLTKSHDQQKHLQAYSEREGTRLSSSGKSHISMQFDQRSVMTGHLPVHERDSTAFHTSPLETGRPLLAYSQSNKIPAARNTQRSNPRTQSTDQMDAFFQTHLENIPIRTGPALDASRHARYKTLTTATSDPTKPSRHARPTVQNLVLHLPVTTTAKTIIRRALARHDRLPHWDCAAPEAYCSFVEHESEKRVVAWVSRLDELLCALYEREGGIRETRDVLEEGVRRALGEVRSGITAKDEGEGGNGEGEEDNCDGVGTNADGDDDGDVEEEMLMDL